MAPPPPAALGAGMVGEAASHCSRSSRVRLAEDPVGEAQGLNSFLRWEPLTVRSSAEAGTTVQPLHLPGRGLQPLCGASPRPAAWNAGFFLRASPWLPGSMCLHRGGGVGALCAECPLFPPRCWSLGSLVEALLGVGVPCGLRGEPSGLKHSWSAACLPASICCCSLKPRGCPGGVVGGGGVLVCF